MASIACTIPATSAYFYIVMVCGQMSRSIINGGGDAFTYSPTLGHLLFDSLPVEPKITLSPQYIH